MTQQELQHIFESEFNWNNWKKVMNFVFPEFKFNLVQTNLALDTKAKDEKAGFIKVHGQTELVSHQTLTLCEILVKDSVKLDRNIKSVRSLVASEVIPNYQAVIAVFHNADNTKWRFTLVVKEFTGDNKTYDKKPDSYTYVFGVGEKGRTASERFLKLANNPTKTLKDLEEAFSVEALSKKFFKEYKDIYLQFVDDIIKEPSRFALFKENSKEKQEKSARDFVKKMMGRLVFLYFLQKKGWLGCKTKWAGGDEAFMKTFVEKAKQNDLFYHQYLEPLFFDTLNDKRSKQDEDCIIQKTNFGKVPYLNGGLFEKDENHPIGLTLKWDIFAGFFETLNNYNFTIVEDDPDFKEVAVDPEMLGHIFENLLEDNKDKGAFYTPKEIVHYMCQESLFEYLKTYLEKNKNWPEKESEATALEKALHNFVTQKAAGKVIDFDKQLAKALKEVKICDPAIGSGAFPMGLLNEIFHCVHVLYDASPDTVGPVWDMDSWQPNKVKLNIIQNSIYGVDIEKGAVDIARLRFWLSLIVDEPEPTALPNLDYKIVVGDSLVSKLGDDIINIDWNVNDTSHGLFGVELAENKKKLLQKISTEQKESFNPESDKKKLAADIRDLKIDLLINQLQLMIKLANQDNEPKATSFTDKKKYNRAIEKYHNVLGWKAQIKRLTGIKQKKGDHLNYFDWKLDFPEVMNEYLVDNAGFDIVIANPPYLGNKEIGAENQKIFQSKFGYKDDMYAYFFDNSIKLLKPCAVLTFITPNTFLTLNTKLHLREKLLNRNIIEFYEVGYVFENAFVDTIISRIKNEQKINKKFAYKRNLPNTSLPVTYIGDIDYYHQSLNKTFFCPSGLNVSLFVKLNVGLKKHYNSIWSLISSIDSSTKTSNLLDKFINEIPVGDFTLLGALCNGGQGLVTGNNSKYLAKVVSSESEARIIRDQLISIIMSIDERYLQQELQRKTNDELYNLAESIKVKLKKPTIFGKFFLYKTVSKEQLVNFEALTDSEKSNGAKYECWVRYYRGNEEGSRWTVLSDEAILWTEQSVKELKESKVTNSRWQGSRFYNSEGFAWVDYFTDRIKAFLLPASPYSKNSVKFISRGKVSDFYILALLNSKFYSYYIKNFITNTHTLQINDGKIIPIKIVQKNIEDRFVQLVWEIIKNKVDGVAISHLEDQIDYLTYKIFNLSFEEVNEFDTDFSLSKVEYDSIMLE